MRRDGEPSELLVGNDVVDLDDPETRLEDLHPRWVERVFAPSERAALDAAASPAERHRLHWALWAAKESAYKARKRVDAAAVFSPGELVVSLGPLPGAGRALGRAAHRGEALAVELRLEGGCLHAVATGGAASGVLRVVAVAEEPAGDPGISVRRLATELVASALNVDAARLEVTGRPPVVRDEGRSLPAVLSLSHHGRYVAVACAIDPGPGRLPAPACAAA